MERKNKILFLVHTEYHLMVCLSAIADKYNDPEKFNVTIYQTEVKAKNRFKNLNPIPLPHVEYKKVQYDESDLSYNGNLKEELNNIESEKVDTLVIFNHHSLLAIYLSRKLSAKGTKIILGPDGSKPYANITSKAPRWSFKYSLKFRRFLKINGLSYRGFYWPSLRYATLKEISEVWIHYPKHYKNHNNKVVEKVRVMETPEAISLISDVFGFNEKELPVNENVYFHVCLPPKEEKFVLFDLELLSELRKRLPDYTIVVKLHPFTNEKQINDLKKIEGCILINSSFPAEFYISKLKSSIVASYWSTASLINNTSCRFYWLYPMLEKKGIMMDYLNLVNPTDHITEVDTIEKIK